MSYCAVCDGAFFEDETIAVIGGGNTAVEEGTYLTKFAKKVYIVHRRDEFRADRAAIEHALSNPKIEPVWNSVVERIEGDGMVENIVLKNVKTGEVSNLAVAGVFMFVGQAPYDEPVRGLVKAAKGGWIITNEDMETSVEGIYAAGDVREKGLRQVITAAGDGAVAAMSAVSYINEQVHLRSVLMEPEHVVAFFYSSIDGNQVQLSEKALKEAEKMGKKLTLVDGYRNGKMVEKLQLPGMPALVELRKGDVVRTETPATLEKVLSFLK